MMTESDDELECRKALQKLIIEAAKKGLEIATNSTDDEQQQEDTTEVTKVALEEVKPDSSSECGYESTSNSYADSDVSDSSSVIINQIQSLWSSATPATCDKVTTVIQENGNKERKVEIYDLNRNTKIAILNLLKNQNEEESEPRATKRQKIDDFYTEWEEFLNSAVQKLKPCKALRMAFVNGTHNRNKTMTLGRTFKAYTEFMDYILSMDHPGEPIPTEAIAAHMCNNDSHPNVTKFPASEVAKLLQKYLKLREG